MTPQIRLVIDDPNSLASSRASVYATPDGRVATAKFAADHGYNCFTFEPLAGEPASASVLPFGTGVLTPATPHVQAGKYAEADLVGRIVSWLDRWREARAGDSRFSKVFFELCTEMATILGQHLMGVDIDAGAVHRWVQVAGTLDLFLGKMAEDMRSTAARSQGRADPWAAAAEWPVQAELWARAIDSVRNQDHVRHLLRKS